MRDTQIQFKYLFSPERPFTFGLNALSEIVLNIKFQPESGVHSPSFDAMFTQLLDLKFDTEGKYLYISTLILFHIKLQCFLTCMFDDVTLYLL